MRVVVNAGDGEAGQLAVAQAAQWAQLMHLEVTLLGVRVPLRRAADPATGLRDRARLFPEPVAVTTRTGRLARALATEAEARHADLVIAGGRQTPALLSWLTGDALHNMVAHAPCPVLLVNEHPRAPHHILLCDSGGITPTLLRLLSDKLPQIVPQIERLTVLHVMSQISAAPGVRGTQLRASAEELIAEHAPEADIFRRDIELAASLGIAADATVRHGLVVDEIVDETRNPDYDLIVIGAHRSAGIPAFLLDDITRQLVDSVTRNLLIIG